eukprot:c3915_g1_i1.p1 GENE.c3915_g1_i1~~c3915_g1_i1.p1  ORF type:complete len:338 (+),score=74.79 c3915_g1_i1:88-1101(+)
MRRLNQIRFVFVYVVALSTVGAVLLRGKAPRLSKMLEAEAKHMDSALQAPSLSEQIASFSDTPEENINNKVLHELAGTRPQSWGDLAASTQYHSIVKGMGDSPFFNERYRMELEAWRDSVVMAQMRVRPDFETQPAFIPGVGYLRPFIRYPHFTPPHDVIPEAPKPIVTQENLAAGLAALQKAKDTLGSASNEEKARLAQHLDSTTQALGVSSLLHNKDGSRSLLDQAMFDNIYPQHPITPQDMSQFTNWVTQPTTNTQTMASSVMQRMDELNPDPEEQQQKMMEWQQAQSAEAAKFEQNTRKQRGHQQKLKKYEDLPWYQKAVTRVPKKKGGGTSW